MTINLLQVFATVGAVVVGVFVGDCVAKAIIWVWEKISD